MRSPIACALLLIVGCTSAPTTHAPLPDYGDAGVRPGIGEGEGEGTTSAEGEGEGEGEGASTWAIVNQAPGVSVLSATAVLADGTVVAVFHVAPGSTFSNERGVPIARAEPGVRGCLVLGVDLGGRVLFQSAIELDDSADCGQPVATPDGGFALVFVTFDQTVHAVAGAFSADVEPGSAALVHVDASGAATAIEPGTPGCQSLAFAAWPDGSTILATGGCRQTADATVQWRDGSGVTTDAIAFDLGSAIGPVAAQLLPLDAAPPRIAVIATGASGSAPLIDSTIVDVERGSALIGVLQPAGFAWAYTVFTGNADHFEAGAIDGSILRVVGSIEDGELRRLGVDPPTPHHGLSAHAAELRVTISDGSIAAFTHLDDASPASFGSGFAGDEIVVVSADSPSCGGCFRSTVIEAPLATTPSPISTKFIASVGDAIFATGFPEQDDGTIGDITALVPTALAGVPGVSLLMRMQPQLH